MTIFGILSRIWPVLVASECVLASQLVMMGIGYEGQVPKKDFRVEICNQKSSVCKAVDQFAFQQVSSDTLKSMLEESSDLARSDRLLLRWGYIESSVFAQVAVLNTEVRSGHIHTVYFPDTPHEFDLRCPKSDSPVFELKSRDSFFSTESNASHFFTLGKAKGQMGTSCY